MATSPRKPPTSREKLGGRTTRLRPAIPPGRPVEDAHGVVAVRFCPPPSGEGEAGGRRRRPRRRPQLGADRARAFPRPPRRTGPGTPAASRHASSRSRREERRPAGLHAVVHLEGVLAEPSVVLT